MNFTHLSKIARETPCLLLLNGRAGKAYGRFQGHTSPIRSSGAIVFSLKRVTYIPLHGQTVAVQTVSDFGHGFQTDGVTACLQGVLFSGPVAAHVL